MAIRARLSAPREVRQEWHYHNIKSASLPASMLFSGDRRMEADNFLAAGFATRQAILSKKTGWKPLVEVALTWQPGRLKGIQVSSEFGTPFLAATQVFDVRPVARKWLSLNRTEDHKERFVSEGTILLTCSGSVGRATVADASIANTLVSHDLLRIEAKKAEEKGWIYAYLRTPAVRAMMTSAQYGHMIKHLEVSHLDALPLVECPSVTVREECLEKFNSIVSARNEAIAEIEKAEIEFERQFPLIHHDTDEGENGFSVSASQTLMVGRRRFDAFRNNPYAQSIEERLAANTCSMDSLRSLGCEVWLPNRFRRVPAENGVDLVDSSSIFEINPDHRRTISATGISDRNGGFVKEDWLLMSRSGQVYGLLGSVAMATPSHLGKVVTDDIIRIRAGEDVDPGYLHLSLSHTALGRPRVKSLAYGSSIPHIEVEDLLDFTIPRMSKRREETIGSAVRRAYKKWSEADRVENELRDTAEALISRFLSAN